MIFKDRQVFDLIGSHQHRLKKLENSNGFDKLDKFEAQIKALADKVNTTLAEQHNKMVALGNNVGDQRIRLECLKIAKDVALSGTLGGDVDLPTFTDRLVAYVKGGSEKLEDDAKEE